MHISYGLLLICYWILNWIMSFFFPDIALLYLKKKKMEKRRMRLKKPKVESTKEKQEESDVVQGKRESSQVSNDKIEETAS
jgi:predicted membrane protein